MSLATKYRPQTFKDVCGQSITVTILERVIQSKTFKNCYIFSGKSGCGKTTVARLFARAINNNVGEPIEIDAASNNGVDAVRAIVDSAKQRDLISEYKVFIIDECHSLTIQAWQAFLKGIEECPKYTIFIFCTTEQQKLPATILNRMQKYTFAPIASQEIKARLLQICQLENYTHYEDACEYISKLSEGGMRSAINYLEQCADYSTDLNLNNVKKVLSNLSYEYAFKLTWAIQGNDEAAIFNIIDNIYNAGKDLKAFLDWYISFILDVVKYIIFKTTDVTNIPNYLALPENPILQHTVENEKSLVYFNTFVNELLDIKQLLRYDTDYKNTLLVRLIYLARTLR